MPVIWCERYEPEEDLMDYLNRYIRDPFWKLHPISIVPLIAGKGYNKEAFWRTNGIREEHRRHVFWILKQWAAFRPKSPDVVIERTKRHLNDYVTNLKEISIDYAISTLTEVDIEEFNDFTDDVINLMEGFNKNTKRTVQNSLVYPSKVAHLFLPNLIPAYDKTVIEDKVLKKLYNGRRRSFRIYLKICWLILKKLMAEDRLVESRNLVKEFLLDDWIFNAMRIPVAEFEDIFILNNLDSLVAEYILIKWEEDFDGRRLKPFN